MDGFSNNIKVVSTFDYSPKSIENLYACVFATKPTHNIFLSAEWILPWLECAANKPELITFIDISTNSTLGFAFLGCQQTALGKVFYLNQTGNEHDDQIWIEYNDVISASHHKSCQQALLGYVAKQANRYKFVAINAINTWHHPMWRNWSTQAINGYLAATLNNAGTPTKAKNIAEASTLSSHFSKNTKSQISRSLRFITERYGELTLTWLQPEHIESALSHMGCLHIEQWGSHAFGSGFNNPQFVEFHRIFMQKGMNSYVHVAKYTAGEQTLGYLYFFTRKQQVYFYLSAINYGENDNKYKPGLLMHKLAMQHFSSLGYTQYNFLAGDARYKTSLSNQKYLLYSLQLYVNKWYYWPIKACVNIKRWLVQSAKQP